MRSSLSRSRAICFSNGPVFGCGACILIRLADSTVAAAVAARSFRDHMRYPTKHTVTKIVTATPSVVAFVSNVDSCVGAELGEDVGEADGCTVGFIVLSQQLKYMRLPVKDEVPGQHRPVNFSFLQRSCAPQFAAFVGETLGTIDGETLGFALGLVDGAIDGTNEGTVLGLALGLSDGDKLGT